MSYFFLILLCILLPLGEIFRLDLNNGIAFTPLDILAGINVLYAIFSLWKTKNARFSPILKGIIFFIGAATISLMFNIFVFPIHEVAIGSLYLIRWIAYSSFFITAAKSIDKTKGMYLLLFSGTIFGFLGIIQYFLYPNLRNLYYAGWDEHYYRLFSTFLDPNFAGIFLVLTFLLGFFLLLTQPLKKYQKYVLTFLNLCLLVCIFLTFSRSAFLSLFTGLITLGIFLKNSRKYILVGIAVSIFAIIIITLNYKFNEGTKLFRTASSIARIESLKDSLSIFTKNPILGIGFDLYRYAGYKYGLMTGPNWEVSHSGAGVENSFAFVLTTTGIVGFFAFMYLFFIIIKPGRTNAFYTPLIIATTLAIILDSFFVNSLFFPEIMAWMWVVFGITENKKL